jgi:hypothetical protein
MGLEAAGACARCIPRAVTRQLEERCQAGGHSCDAVTADGRTWIVIDGERLTPAQAAGRYLPGGCAGNHEAQWQESALARRRAEAGDARGQ